MHRLDESVDLVGHLWRDHVLEHHVLRRSGVVQLGQDFAGWHAQVAGKFARVLGLRRRTLCRGPACHRHLGGIGIHEVRLFGHRKRAAVGGLYRATDRRKRQSVQALTLRDGAVLAVLHALELHKPACEQGEHKGDAEHADTQPAHRITAAEGRPAKLATLTGRLRRARLRRARESRRRGARCPAVIALAAAVPAVAVSPARAAAAVGPARAAARQRPARRVASVQADGRPPGSLATTRPVALPPATARPPVSAGQFPVRLTSAGVPP